MKYIVDNFESIEHLTRTIGARRVNAVFEGKEQSSEKTSDEAYEFTKTRSYSEAAELMRSGYDDPVEKIKKGVEVGAKGFTKRKTNVKQDVVGFAPCVPNAILGLPKSMLNMETTPKKDKIITITYDIVASGWTSTGTLEKAGIAVLTIVNSLEQQGYRVSLKVTIDNAQNGKEFVFGTVNLKDWRQPLDIKKMTFPFCHPSMLRRISFKWLETQPQLTESGFCCGYGQSNPNRYSYENMLKTLRDNKLISEKEKYINIPLCSDKEFNAQEIAKACGLNI